MKIMNTERLLLGELKHSNIFPVQGTSRKGRLLLINTMKETEQDINKEKWEEKKKRKMEKKWKK